MVSNARLDLPEPDRPVTTTRLSRGISSETFLRLWTRAPCTATVVRAAGFAAAPVTCRPAPSPLTAGDGDTEPLPPFFVALELIRRPSRVEECEFLHVDVTHLGQADRHPRLADQPPVGQVFARPRHAADVEIPLEVVFDLGARPRLADLGQVFEH